MNWFLIALTGPILWALVNHIDKYIISRYFVGKGVGSLMIFTALSSPLIAITILLFNFHSLNLNLISIILISLNGIILSASFIPYLYALEYEEASFVTALFQLIPAWVYLLGLVFLNEHLTFSQIGGSLLIITGAIVISLNLGQKINFKAKPFWLMILSTLMLSITTILFKTIALRENFWGTAFWEYIGSAIFGIFLFIFIKLYRDQFITTMKRGGLKIFVINIFSELINMAGKLFSSFAGLLVPLALVWAVNGLQPFFVFIYGIIITILLPKFGREDLSKKIVIQKLSAMTAMFIGIYFLFK